MFEPAEQSVVTVSVSMAVVMVPELVGCTLLNEIASPLFAMLILVPA